jgi:4-hydroxybenzoate polyprenyltransferase
MQHKIMQQLPDATVGLWIQVLRLPNLTMMFVLQFLVYNYILEAWAEAVGIRLYLDFTNFIFVSVSTTLIGGAGYLINDYYDQKIDEINHPKRRVIGNGISMRQAMIAYIGLNTVAMVLVALLIPNYPYLFLLHLSCIALLFLYARYLKAMPLIGNLVIVLLCGILVIEVLLPDYLFNPNLLHDKDFYTPYYQDIARKFAIFVGAATFLRELAKDIEDLKGDTLGGRKTLAVLLGWVRTKYLLGLLSLVFSLFLAAFSWHCWQNAEHYSSIYVGWGLCIPLLIVTVLIFRCQDPSHFSRISKILKIYFGFGMGWLFFFDMG